MQAPIILTPAQMSQITLEDIVAAVGRGNIDLQADYQRAFVWTRPQQAALIDSIYNNYCVPPVIFNRACLPNGQFARRCIDGKQRISTVCRFFHGEFPVIISGTKYFFCASIAQVRAKGTILPPAARFDLENKTLSVTTYHDISLGTELELFKRIQCGLALTSGELLGASADPRVEYARGIAAAYETQLSDCLRSAKRKETVLLSIRLLAMLGGYRKLESKHTNALEHVIETPDLETRFETLLASLAEAPLVCNRTMITTCILARCILEADDAPTAIARANAICAKLANGKAWAAAEKHFT